MARGTGTFNGAALRSARQAAGMSAERLAMEVGTTKAMVLAYEHGKSIPEAGRAARLADVVGVSRAALLPPSSVREEPDDDPMRQMDYEISHSPARRLAAQFDVSNGVMEALLKVGGRIVHQMYDRSVRDLRQMAGLSVEQAAARAGISISTYRAIEREGKLPSRGNGRFPALLADALEVPVRRVEDAIILHPALISKRMEIADLYGRVFQRVEGEPDYSVTAESGEVISMADILGQPPAILARAVGYEILAYRNALRRRADALSRAMYPTMYDVDRAGSLQADLLQAGSRLRHAPEKAAAATWWTLSQALTVRQWRSFVSIVEIQAGTSRRVVFVDEMLEPDVGKALTYVRFRGYPILENLSNDGALDSYRLTNLALAFYESERFFYRCIYPRIQTPILGSRTERTFRRVRRGA
ncbi:helix-turn-helix domain-containing protein [Streptomyces sp. NPDC012421]|uniref:helix-turn-helix domain-containing protein n=1 Tax=Streptomyces sp. NPDC012421 TaxID=3364832 RepID=UPI0036E0AD46